MKPRGSPKSLEANHLLENVIRCLFHLQKVFFYKVFISGDPVHFCFAFKSLFIAVGNQVKMNDSHEEKEEMNV